MGAGIRARSMAPRLTDMALSFVVFLHRNDGSRPGKMPAGYTGGGIGRWMRRKATNCRSWRFSTNFLAKVNPSRDFPDIVTPVSSTSSWWISRPATCWPFFFARRSCPYRAFSGMSDSRARRDLRCCARSVFGPLPPPRIHHGHRCSKIRNVRCSAPHNRHRRHHQNVRRYAA